MEYISIIYLNAIYIVSEKKKRVQKETHPNMLGYFWKPRECEYLAKRWFLKIRKKRLYLIFKSELFEFRNEG